MAVLYSNNASSTLSASITSTATSLSVASGAGALFPAPSGSDYFYITLVNSAGAMEIMKVTARSADTLTVVRGQDGTTGVAWAAGDRVELRFTKAMLDDIKGERMPVYGPSVGSGGRVMINLSGNPAWSDANFTYDPITASFRAANLRGAVGDAAPTWNFNNILHAGNYSSYALPLGGGTLTGTLNVNANDGLKATYGGTDGDTWYRGWGMESNRTTVYIRPTTNGVQSLRIGYSENTQNWIGVRVDANTFTHNGYNVLNANNYSSYALPLSGGTLSSTETRAISFVFPASYNGTGYSNLIERINFPWYSEYWDIGVRRGGGVDIQSMEWWLNGSSKLMELTRGGVLYVNGNTVLHSGNYTGYVPAMNQIVYGNANNASNGISATQNVYELGQYKSGFWDVYGAAWMPNTDWYWGGTFAHTSNSSGYNYSGQIAFRNGGGGSYVYVRTISNGATSAWGRVLTSTNYTDWTSAYVLKTGDTMTGRLTIDGSGWTTNNRNYSNEWIEFGNYSGLYSPNNGAHFYPNNGSYGSWRSAGSRNGWAGIEFDASNGQMVLMIDPASNTSGFHNNSYGWQFRWNNGTAYVYKNAYGGGTAATVLDSSNYSNYALPIGGGWYGTGLPGSRWGGYSVNGGEISFGRDLPNTGQMGILVDGCYVAGENNGFWSMGSDNTWGSRRGMYWDGTYLRFDYGSPVSKMYALTVGNWDFYENSGGWNANIIAAGIYHGRVRVKASSYNSSGDQETYMWVDNTVTPSTGMYSTKSLFNFNGSITTVQVAGNTVLTGGNFTNYVPYGYPGWPGYPGTDANSFHSGSWLRSSFTYANNAPHTGTIVHFPSSGYDLQLNGSYGGTSLSFRNRNGDNGTWNAWNTVLHSGNYTSYVAGLGGGNYTGTIQVTQSGTVDAFKSTNTSSTLTDETSLRFQKTMTPTGTVTTNYVGGIRWEAKNSNGNAYDMNRIYGTNVTSSSLDSGNYAIGELHLATYKYIGGYAETSKLRISSGSMYFHSGGTQRLQWTAGAMYGSDGAYDIGASSYRMGTVYTYNLTFADGTTQTTAGGAPASNSAIGAVVWAWADTSTQIFGGGTIAGSSLYIANTSATVISTSFLCFNSTSPGYVGSFYVNKNNSFSNSTSRISSGNSGYQSPPTSAGATVLSGTWRLLSNYVAVRSSYYDGYSNITTSQMNSGMWIRIA